MKTKKQIEHFLRKAKYKSSMEFDGISMYCRGKHDITLHTPSQYYPDSPTALDYSTFADWYENGFGAGDAVQGNGFIALVQSGDVTTVKICLKIDGNGPIFDSETIPVGLLTRADENALNRLNLALEENGFEFGNPFFLISSKFIPDSGCMVRFVHHHTKAEGYGVIRMITPEGEVIMYCYAMKDGSEVKCCMHESIGNVHDFTFSAFKSTDYARKYLESELNKLGKSWNQAMKRVEPIHMRVDNGMKYWYITEKMQVRSAIERGKAVDNKRYQVLNYFPQEEWAVEYAKQAMEQRRDFFCRIC